MQNATLYFLGSLRRSAADACATCFRLKSRHFTANRVVQGFVYFFRSAFCVIFFLRTEGNHLSSLIYAQRSGHINKIWLHAARLPFFYHTQATVFPSNCFLKSSHAPDQYTKIMICVALWVFTKHDLARNSFCLGMLTNVRVACFGSRNLRLTLQIDQPTTGSASNISFPWTPTTHLRHYMNYLRVENCKKNRDDRESVRTLRFRISFGLVP